MCFFLFVYVCYCFDEYQTKLEILNYELSFCGWYFLKHLSFCIKIAKHECQNATATYCCISALVLTCFLLKKGRAMFFRPETIFVSFLNFMVLLPKVLFNNISILLYKGIAGFCLLVLAKKLLNCNQIFLK